MSNQNPEYVVNPLTGRLIKTNGPTYRKLMAQQQVGQAKAARAPPSRKAKKSVQQQELSSESDTDSGSESDLSDLDQKE